MVQDLIQTPSFRPMVVRTRLKFLSPSEEVTRIQAEEDTRPNPHPTIIIVRILLQMDSWMIRALFLLMAHSKQSRLMACITIQDLLGTDPQLTWQMKENLRM